MCRRLDCGGGSLESFWHARGNFREGRLFLTSALAQSESAPVPARAKSYTALGVMAWMLGGFEQAILEHNRALTN